MMNLLVLLSMLAPASAPCLYDPPADVERARLNVERFEWARSFADEVLRGADGWAAMSEDDLRALVPPPGSVFAYGFSGCPECGADWPWWGAKGLASLEMPRSVRCPSCERSFPDARHPDDGAGWHSEADEKTYYFIGCYNSYAAQQVTLYALDDLSTAYALTGQARYAAAAAALFDALAATYPTCTVGSIDYPSKNNSGRLERPQYQVARVLVRLANYLELMYDSPEFAAASKTGPGSIRERVEEAILRDGGQYCFDKASDGHAGLTNGQADYVRGTLAAGMMLQHKPWIDCAVSGPYSVYSFLENCLDRDGQYYETSAGYSTHGLGLYVDMAEMLRNLRTPEHPNGIDLYRHPKLQKALFSAFIDFDVFGHRPSIGDDAPDRAVVTSADPYDLTTYINSEILCARAADARDAARWAAARAEICGGDVEARRSAVTSKYWKNWLLFSAEPAPAAAEASSIEPAPVLGGRGMAILRSGTRPDGLAAVVRYGTSHNHGHLDDLNLNLFGLGRQLTYDLGYNLGSAHVQTGWSHQTASHNLVVVNEKSQMAGQDSGGGELRLLVEEAPVRVLDASSPASYASEDVSDYSRTVALVDLPGSGGYFVDIFRVTGGASHDLMWHFGGEMNDVRGANLGDVEQGSLAGPEYEWGNKLGASGDLVGEADKGPYWNVPPGNGYGFLVDVRRSDRVEKECIIDWQFEGSDNAAVTLRLLTAPGDSLVTARAPGILPQLPKADYAIVRRSGDYLRSAFASVVEPRTGAAAIVSAHRMAVLVGPADAVGVEVRTAAGIDYLLSNPGGGYVEWWDSEGKSIELNGRFAFLRSTGGQTRGVLADATSVAKADLRIEARSAAEERTVMGIDYANCSLKLSAPLPRELERSIAYISGPGYTHSSPYSVASVSDDGAHVTLGADFVLGRGHIRADAEPGEGFALANEIPLPKAVNVRRRPSGYFDGKLIVNDRTGAQTTVIGVEADLRTVNVRDSELFGAGDSFTIYDIREGDTLRIPLITRL